MKDLPLKTTVTHEGQAYVDEEILVQPKAVPPLANAVSAALGGDSRTPRALVVGHERVRLRWMRPDGKGGLVPR